ncbi:serpin family protein [Adhaeribacter swui]|uniref:Serpin family protein n=1 Tax=Adhaeribacter swui TaxID=2086471 RepID=A0A7G7GC54_9BACT|nr:serpin family protein [Adhaeribacter swui]QNF34738.1 serpin family protein [Adhaeribacter swui]
MHFQAVKFLFLGAAGALLLLSSCQKEIAAPGGPNTPPLVRPLAAQEVKIVNSANNFAFKSFETLRQKEENQNIFISPFSISSALTMTYNGADGSTKEAMRQTLGFEPQTDEELNQAYKTLTELLTNLDSQVKFTAANSIWYSRHYQLQAPFVQNSQNYFNAALKDLDFDSPAAKNIINDWVKNNTQGKITNMVQTIRPDHVLFLINALYFKGTWTYPFNKKLTQPAPFQKEDGSTVNVNLMTLQNGRYRYYQDASKQVIDLPYGNRQFSMTLIVPRGQHTVGELSSSLSSTQLTDWLNNADSSRLELKMPKFKLEYEKKLNLALTQLGMGEAFGNQANFSKMLQDANQHLAISEVKHKTFVEVNEEGTEAAAATSVGMMLTSMPQSIQVNRPFLFLIREKSSNAILFIGQLMNP